MPTKTHWTDGVRTYTLEEIDDNLSTLATILKYSKTADEVSVMRQVDNWLDRRVELTNAA